MSSSIKANLNKSDNYGLLALKKQKISKFKKNLDHGREKKLWVFTVAF